MTPQTSPQGILHYYRKTKAPHSLLPSIGEELRRFGLDVDVENLSGVETESCFNIQPDRALSEPEQSRLEWLLAETFEKGNLRLETSFLSSDGDVLEFGPRMTFTSAFSSNATSICKACNIPVGRCELSLRYKFIVSKPLSEKALGTIKAMLHDRMTQQEYLEPVTSFETGIVPEAVKTVPIMAEGRPALEKINEERGLGFDDFDLDYYTALFKVRTNKERERERETMADRTKHSTLNSKKKRKRRVYMQHWPAYVLPTNAFSGRWMERLC